MKTLNQLFFSAWLLSNSVCAIALTSDAKQPIDIEANSAQLNDDKGIAIYSGNVIVRQGTLNITADQVTVYHQNKKVEKVVAVGKPARYQQQADGQQGMINALANTIEYATDNAQVVLSGNAKLDQNGNTIEGEKINYDIAHKIGSAGGDPLTNQAGRIKMVFQPKTKPKAPAPSSTPKPNSD